MIKCSRKIASFIISLVLVLTTSVVPGIAETNETSDDDINSTEIIEGINSTIVENEDGEKKAVFFSEDVRFEEEGELFEYDPSLVKIDGSNEVEQKLLRQGYSYENNIGDKKQYFPGSLSENKPIIMNDGKHEIKFSLNNEQISELLGSKQELKLSREKFVTAENEIEEKKLVAEYRGEETALEYESASHGIKESIIFYKKPESLTEEGESIFEINFAISVKNLIVEAGKSGELIYKDMETGKVKAVSESPFLNDKTENAYFNEIETEIFKVETQNGVENTAVEESYQIRYKLPKDYFESQQREYPITFDPSTSWGASTSAYVFSPFPTYSYGSRTLMPVGIGTGDGKSGSFRTYLKFSDAKDILKGKSITDAKLKVVQTGGGSSSQTVNLYESNGVYTATGLNWNNQPGSKGSLLASISSSSSSGTGRTFTPLKTQMQHVANDTNGTNNASYVLMRSSTVNGYSPFYGSGSSSEKRPTLTVTYKDKPTKPSKIGFVDSSSNIERGASPVIEWADLGTSISYVQYRIASVVHNTNTVINSSVLPLATLKSGDYGAGSQQPSTIKNLPDGCYRLYIRGVDTNAQIGAEGYFDFHIDSTAPSLASINLGIKELRGDTKENPSDNQTPTIEWKNAIDTHLKQIQYYVDGKMGPPVVTTAANGSFKVDAKMLQSSGEHTITAKAVDLSGKESGLRSISYHLDRDVPLLYSNNIKLLNNEAAEIKTWTSENNPKIYINSIIEPHSWLTAEGFSYKVLNEKGEVEIADGKCASLAFGRNPDNSYFASFYLDEATKILPSSAYTIVPIVKDVLGNSSDVICTPEISYKKDTDAPTLNLVLSVDRIREGAMPQSNIEVDLGDISGDISIYANIYDKPIVTDSQAAKDKIKKTVLKIIDETGKEKSLLDNYKISKVVYLDTTRYKNGNYEIIYEAEDTAGNKASEKLDFVIANRIAAPKASEVITNKQTAEISWKFFGEEKISGIEYKLEVEDEWQKADTTAKELIEKGGLISIDLPKEEGEYIAELRCIDEAGLSGLSRKVNILIDKTAPKVSALEIDRGILYGKISEGNGYSYKIYLKLEKDGVEKYQEIAHTGAEKGEGRLGIINIFKSEFEDNSWLSVKVEATDEAGNIGNASKETYKEEMFLYPELIYPKFRIKRSSNQHYEESTIYLSTKTKNLELEGIGDYKIPSKLASGIKWFVDGKANSQKENNHEKYYDNFSVGIENSKYLEGKNYAVSASLYGLEGKASFSRPILKNRDVVDVDFVNASEEIEGIYKEIPLNKSIVGFTIMGSGKSRTGADLSYEVGTSKENLTRIKVGENYGIYEITGTEVSTESIFIKVSQSGYLEKEYLRAIKLGVDVLDIENFSIRTIEDFAPINLNAQDKINYKTYLRWDVAVENEDGKENKADIPENINFEIYRGDTPDFEPKNSNKIASGVKDKYYADINVAYAESHYYKVVAVDEAGERSQSSRGVKSIGVDSSEFSKRLGLKDYWSYSETAIPSGTISVEKSGGNLYYSQTDASIYSESLPMDFERTYNAMSSSKSAFGVGWSHSFDIELLNISEESESKFKKFAFKDETGSLYMFAKTKDGSNRYISTMGGYLELTEASDDEPFTDELELFDKLDANTKKPVTVYSRYKILTKDNIEYKFNSGGQLLLIKEANGNVILLNYDDNTGRLIKVSNTLGLSINIYYKNENNLEHKDHALIERVELPDGGEIKYKYDGDERLYKVTRVEGKTQNGAVIPDEENEEAAQKEELSYTYEYDSKIFEGKPTDNLSHISDGIGNVYRAEYDYEYNNDKNRKSAKTIKVKTPENSYIEYEYSSILSEGKKEATSEATQINYFEKGLFRCQQNEYFELNSGNNVGTGRIRTEQLNIEKSIEPEESWLEYSEFVNGMPMYTSAKIDTAHLGEGGRIIFEETLKRERTKYNDDLDELVEIDAENNGSIYEYDNKSAGFVQQIAKEYEFEDESNGFDYDEGDDPLDYDPISKTEYDYDEYGNETEEESYVWDEIKKEFVLETRTETDYITENEDETSKLAGEIESETEIDEAGLKTVTTYDTSIDEKGHKKVVTKTIAAGETVESVNIYDLNGNEIYADDGIGNITESSYDGFSRLIKEINKTGDKLVTIEKNYNKNGSLIYEKNSNGYETFYSYDSVNTLIETRTNFAEEEKISSFEYGFRDIEINTAAGKKFIHKARVQTEKNALREIISETYTDLKGQVVRAASGGLITDYEYTE
ncbi:MAG: DNRLRE domain-containing protein, partial [Anaerovoracaceae bacterium]